MGHEWGDAAGWAIDIHSQVQSNNWGAQKRAIVIFFPPIVGFACVSSSLPQNPDRIGVWPNPDTNDIWVATNAQGGYSTPII